MTTPGSASCFDKGAELRLSLALIVFLVAATCPYVWLIEHFEYDDILREPTAVILEKFQAGGTPLVLAWFGFAMGSLLFIPVVLGFERLLAARQIAGHGAALLGVGSAISQAIGLLRWVLLVPALSASFVDPQSSSVARDMIVIAFDTVHRYGGTVIGEMVGQVLLAGWTGLTSWQLFRSRAVPRWLAATGAMTLPFWLVGQTELLHRVIPSIPAIEVIPVAFMAWEAWLAALAVALMASAWRSWRHA